MNDKKSEARERTKEIAAEFSKSGDATGWFEALYKEADGNNESIPWADLEPNRFLREWAEKARLRGNGEKALVVGCGLGDDAKFLYDLGFDGTAFDISPTAIEWANAINDETRRMEAVRTTYRLWRGQNPADADAWLAKSRLTPEQRQAFIKSVP